MTTATFTNGKTYTIKNSKKAYSHAWQVTVTYNDGDVFNYNGFATTADLAAKAAASQIAYNRKNNQIAKVKNLPVYATEVVAVA